MGVLLPRQLQKELVEAGIGGLRRRGLVGGRPRCSSMKCSRRAAENGAGDGLGTRSTGQYRTPEMRK